MTFRTPGIHHVTAIAGDAQRNLDFYTGVLGLRLLKRTVNFDDPSTYHLYYGDETGRPGSVLTFFPFGNARAGRPGAGQVLTTAFLVPQSALGYWVERLGAHDVAVEAGERFDDRVLGFTDHDGLSLELVAGPSAGDIEPWADGPVPAEHAVRGFHGATLALADPEPTADLLAVMGFEEAAADARRRRFAAAADLGATVDLVEAETRGVQGAGTVHHVAFRAPDAATQAAWRDALLDRGLRVTDVKDRQYFRSIYFREPGGVLFEIATDGPGFTRDEAVESLGTSLRLPPWLEDDREAIVSRLPPLEPPAVALNP